MRRGRKDSAPKAAPKDAQPEKVEAPVETVVSRQGLPSWDFKEDKMPRNETPVEEGARNCWCEIAADIFTLRGQNYNTDKQKYPSKPAAFALVTSKVLGSTTPLAHFAASIKSLSDFLASRPSDFFVVVVRMLPGTPQRSVLLIFMRQLPEGEDGVFDRTWKRFVEGDAVYRDARFKYICTLAQAPWVVRKSVDSLGGQRPVIMGKGYLKQMHFSGPNYIEVDVDVSSSRPARMIAGNVIGYCNAFMVNECFVIEGQAEDELPERAVGLIQFRKVDITKSVITVESEDLAMCQP